MEDDILKAGMLKAIDSFSQEIFRAGLYSYQTTANQKVTLIKEKNHYLALMGDHTSLQILPPIIRNFIFKEEITEKNLESLKTRLQWIFWPKFGREHWKKGIIITVGRTFGPVFFAISRHAPNFVALITSEDTKQIAIDLIKFFGFELELNAKLLICDQNDTTAITIAGLEALKFLSNKQLMPTDISVNATGGTKGMTIAIAHISFVKNISVYYVYSARAQKVREDHIYGDECVEYLDNPADSVGIYFEEVAKEAFNSHNFLKAREYFEKLNSVFDANRRTLYQSFRELAVAYYAWDLFNFKEAKHYLRSAIKIMMPNLRSDFGRQYQHIWEQIQAQNEVLSKLDDQKLDNNQQLSDYAQLILYFELLNNATRRFTQKKYDDAIARLYRFLEATAQLLLRKKYQIHTSKFNETARHLPPHIKKLFKLPAPQTPFITLNFLTNLFQSDSLPAVISLKNSWHLLECLDSEIQKSGFVSKLGNALPLRNLSILAHGWTPIKEKAKKSFDSLLLTCIQLIQDAFQADVPDVLNLQKTLEFVNL